MSDRSRLQNRVELLSTAAMIALLGGLAYAPRADAQLAASPVVVTGDVSVTNVGPTTSVSLNGSTAIINWTTNDLSTNGTINVLPTGSTVRFQSAGDFTVLNRIFAATPGQAISLNGAVQAQNFAGLPAGSVWIYSPGGIIAGPTSTFNVGNLILTADDIDTTGGLTGPGGTIRFRGVANSTSAVTVQAGAQINLTRAGSYLALVAPQVAMAGTATINGSAAYVAAEQVDITVNNGLFDMSFLTGTDVANALTHTGTTTGPAGTGSIALATMPKNTAVTLLASGTIGYTPAATALVQNGTVVLSAGYNLAGSTAISTPSDRPGGNVTIGNAAFTSQVSGSATDTLSASPTTPGALSFSGNVDLAAENLVSFGADSGETVSVGGTLQLSSSRSSLNPAASAGTARLYSTATPGSPLAAPVVTLGGFATVGATATGNPSETGQSATGGTALIDVTGGTLNLNGGVNLTANALGGDGGVTGGNATAGTARLTLAGGTITVGGLMFVTADATGGAGLAGSSGSAIGGNASVVLNAGATPSILNLSNFGHQISAAARVGGQFRTVDGGNATGGTAALLINSGTVTAIDLAVNASAAGGDASTGTGGTTSGGAARVAITGGRLDVGTLRVTADENQAASDSGTSGSTTGSGLAAVDVSGPGILNVGVTGGNSLTLSANGVVASAAFGIPPTGGSVVGGTARLTSTAGGTIFIDATAPSAPKPPVLVTADVIFTSSDPAVASSMQRGGSVSVIADGGSMSLHKLDLHANAIVRTFANAGGPAGPSFGGSATLAARNGGTLTVRAGSGVTPVAAYATGGTVATPLLGTGGTIDIAAQGGTLSLPDGLTADARGFAGNTLGGTGGSIALRSLAGTGGAAASFTAGPTSLDASGQISAGLPNGTGGTITVTNTGQTMTLANLLARAGAANGAPSGAITLTADNAPITTTAAFTGIDLGTLGTLTLNAIGPLGSIVGSTGVFGFANDIFVSHTGVAGGTATTLTGPSVSLTAGRDQIHTGDVRVQTGDATLIGRRILGGGGSTILATGDIRLGSGLLATSDTITFRTLSAAGVLGGTQGVSSTSPEITTPGSFTVNTNAFAGVANIDIRAGTGVDIADAGTSATGQVLLSSTTGDVRLGTSGVALATRPNAITLAAPSGAARFTDIRSRGLISAAGATGIFGGDAAAAFGLSLSSSAGSVAAGALQATSTTVSAAGGITTAAIFGQSVVSLTATNGAISATSATTGVGGAVSASGTTGVDIATVSSGAVTLSAPNGAVRVATDLRPTGALIVSGQSLFLRAVGSLATGTLAATGAGGVDVATGGALTLTSVQAPLGPVALSGATGLTVPTLVSGGSTILNAANGAVSVGTNLQSAGLVTASGRSLFLRATGALPAATLASTAGNIDVLTGGALSFTNAQATGNLILGAATTVTGGTASATGIANIGTATGGNVTLTALTAGGNAVISGNANTATLAVGTTVVGGFLEARAAALNFGNITAGTDVLLSSFNGALTVGDVTAGDDVFLTVNGSFANPATISPDSQTGQTSTTQFALTSGNLRSTGLGSDTAGSGPRTFTGAGPAGNVVRVRASGTVQTGAITTPGTAIIVSDLASLATGAIAAPLGVGLFVSGNATTGNIATGGALWIGNSTQNFLVVPSYSISNFPFFQTPTNGGATLGATAAGIIRASVLTNFGYASASATGDILLTTGNSSTIGGAVTGGAITAGASLTVTAGNGATFTTANAGTTLSIGAGLGNLSGVSATAVQFVGLSSAQTLTMSGDVVTTGAASGINVGGNTVVLRDVTSAGSALIGATGNLTVRNVTTQGDTELRAGGTAAFAAINAGGVGYLNTFIGGTPTGGGVVNGGTIVAGLDVSVLGTEVTLGNVRAGTSVAVASDGGIAAGAITATNAVGLTAGTGSVTAASLSGQQIDVAANTGITVPTITSAGAVTLTATNGAVSVATNIGAGSVVASGRSVLLRSTGALNLTNGAATAGVLDVDAAGNLTVGTSRAAGDIALRSGNDLTVTTAVEAGYDFTNQTGGGSASGTLNGQNIIINGSVRAGRDLGITATDTVTINGNNTAGRSSTNILSADIVIGANGVLGAVGTRLNLSSTARQLAVGNITSTAGWRLDAAEIARIVAQDVTISTTDVSGSTNAFNSPRAPDILVGDFTVTGGTQIGGEGAFAIQTTGKVRVTGSATFNGMTRDNIVAIQGFEEIDVLDAGKIVLNGANGLDGTLALTSRNIVAASSAALADFTSAADLTAISDRAGRNEGAINDGGYLQAGGIRATLLNSTLIIQNTGVSAAVGSRDFAARRGFTVGAGGFTVIQGGANPMRVAINGRAIGTTTPSGAPTVGGFVTGLDLLPLLTFQPVDGTAAAILKVPANGVLSTAQLSAAARLLDPASTVNGCAITGGAGCRTVANDDPIRDLLNEDFGKEPVRDFVAVKLIQLKDYVTPGDDPLIDEPVTGAGNDDLWSADDSKPKCDPAKEACEAPR